MISDYNIKRLIEQAYSKNAATRALARVKLRKEHPDLYAELEVT